MDRIVLSQADSRELQAVGLKPVVFSVGESLCYDNAAAVVESLRDLIADGPRNLELDMGGLELIDSSGLRALLQARRFCEENGKRLTLSDVPDCVARIFSLSHLSNVFGVATEPSLGFTAPPAAIPADSHWKVYEYRATSDPAMISVMRQHVTDAAIEAGATGEDLCDIQIAAGEALTNAYKHGSPNKGTDTILLRCLSCAHAIVVEVQDEGHRFDPNCNGVPDPRHMRDHGMGIYLMREAMNEVEFEHNCPGNRVRMVKWISKD